MPDRFDRFDRFDRKTLAPKIRLAASYSLQAPIVVPCLKFSRRQGTPTSPKISWVIAREQEHMRLIRKSWQVRTTKTWEISEMLFRLQIHSLLISLTEPYCLTLFQCLLDDSFESTATCTGKSTRMSVSLWRIVTRYCLIFIISVSRVLQKIFQVWLPCFANFAIV